MVYTQKVSTRYCSVPSAGIRLGDSVNINANSVTLL